MGYGPHGDEAHGRTRHGSGNARSVHDELQSGSFRGGFLLRQGRPGRTVGRYQKEQDLVSQADHLIFVYPNWHDSEITIVKGYKEKVFAKKFAYQDGANGLEGLLKDKSYFTIMNCGYLGGGRGYIGDGVGIEDEKWDTT